MKFIKYWTYSGVGERGSFHEGQSYIQCFLHSFLGAPGGNAFSKLDPGIGIQYQSAFLLKIVQYFVLFFKKRTDNKNPPSSKKTPLFSRAESGSGIQISPLQSLQACLASKHKKKNLSNRTKASSDTDDPVREKTRTSYLM